MMITMFQQFLILGALVCYDYSKFSDFSGPDSINQDFASLLFMVFTNGMISSPETHHLIHKL